MLLNIFTFVFQQDRSFLGLSFLLASLVAIIIVVLGSSSFSYLKYIIKRFIQIQLRKRLFDPPSQSLETGIFASFYRKFLCHLQTVNNELLRKILKNNHKCAFYLERSISYLSSIDEFRNKVSLTTYDDYRDYIDRIVKNGEGNMVTSDKIDYFAKSSGTTGESKLIPMAASTIKPGMMVMRVAYSKVLMSLPSSFPSPEQRTFQLRGGKKFESFPRTKGGIPFGSVSLYPSAVPSNPLVRLAVSSYDVLSLDLIEEIPDFETTVFVQLVFALAVPDIYSYTVSFAPAFIHSIKIIEKYSEEMVHCISTANFDHSSFVRENISDSKLKRKLNRTLDEVTVEYGGSTYRLKRAEHIRNECLKKDTPGLLHRLWPNLVYAATVLGSSFAMYKNEIEGYCGKRLPLINLPFYLASEAAIGILANVHTDEYFLTPTHAFLEFIKEEDILQDQPKTLLVSEIEPGHRYELVITTEGGLVRYRMGDVVLCTRFLSRADDLLPLPAEPAEIPRIPLISMAYRIGSLLNVFGEKTTEEHLLYALKQTIHDWNEQGIPVELCDFTSFAKLDAFPIHYVIFFELMDGEGHKVNDQQRQIMQNTLDSEVERRLYEVNSLYNEMRAARKLDPAECILVRNGTFSTLMQKIFTTVGVNPVQVKSPRLLKDKNHIQFFYDNQINISSY